MKSKDKKVKKKSIITFLTSMIILLTIVYFYNYYFGESKVYAKEEVEDVKISNAEEVDIQEMINQNSNEGQKEEYQVHEAVLEYLTTYRNNPSLPKGQIQVIQEGREGKQEITTKKIRENEEEKEEQVSSKITKASVNKIVEIGTSNSISGNNNYNVKVGDTIYVTSDRLGVWSEPSEQSQKLATLTQNDKLKVLEVTNNEWYKIVCSSITGYVKSENTRPLNNYPTGNKEQKNPTTNQKTSSKSKQELLNKVSFGMQLNQPSGLSLEQFKKVLNDSRDTNKIFENNAEYFYYIEEQYSINGVFVAAIGIHESAWGTSKIAKDKNNLFGYGAYDSNPYNGAYNFSNYAESIDLMARVLVKYYLNPKGTSIYGNEKALGTYYNGPTLSGVNTKYATDKNWANAVFNKIQYLYNKL